MERELTIKGIIESSYETAKEKGWWKPEKSFGELIALIHSELSEALEEYRTGKKPTEVYYNELDLSKDPKPEGIPIELADVIIRIADLCGHYGVDLEDAIRQKLIYNQTRPHRHGGKKL